MPTNLDYVAVLRSQVGKPYCNEGPWRCTMERGCADCSGFDCWGLNQLGIAYPCSNTDLMAFDLRRKGLLVSAAYARATPGCWAIRLSGSHHMVCSIGGGKVVEAASHALGIRIGNFDGRGFTVFGKPPGLLFPGSEPGVIEGNPMYGPNDICDVYDDGHGNVWGLQPSGGVLTLRGGPFFGSYATLRDAHGHPLPSRTDFAHITGRQDGHPGYTLWPVHFTNPMQHFDFPVS